ncbi:MAG: sulfatase-like hydrolase/transferase, partial [Saprospiraceae bacterium]
MFRPILLAFILFSIFACSSEKTKITKKTANTAPPNILFIMSDDHAEQAISAYGSKMIETPHIDRIAKEGILFKNSFVTNSICGPSRAVLLTGKYSHLNGLRDNRDKFDGNQLTFPKLLQKAGYQTSVIGKWHLKTHPTGFDYWNILINQGHYYNPKMVEMGKNGGT